MFHYFSPFISATFCALRQPSVENQKKVTTFFKKKFCNQNSVSVTQSRKDDSRLI